MNTRPFLLRCDKPCNVETVIYAYS